MAITSANQLELLQTAEAVAREKNDRPCVGLKRWKNPSPALQNPVTARKWTFVSPSTAKQVARRLPVCARVVAMRAWKTTRPNSR